MLGQATHHTFTVIAKRHRDGSVVLSAADDRICKLNGVGALTWMVLEQSETALNVDEVVRELSAQFDAINAEGELLYDVAPAQLREDTARFLASLIHMNLLYAKPGSDGREYYRIKAGVSGTTSATVAAITEPQEITAVDSRIPSLQGSTEDPPVDTSISTDIKPSKRETFSAFLGLLAFDLMLRLAGFNTLITRVESWPIAEPRSTDGEMCRRVRAMVDRAQMYYPKKAMCLQHSAVVTCLLRRRGVPAEMVLAAQEFPPKAHAWVEVLNEVVNDSGEVKEKYYEFRRL